MSGPPVRGRPPKKDYAALYEGWPEVSLGAVSDVNDKKLLRLVRNFQTAFNDILSEGKLLRSVTLPAKSAPPMQYFTNS